MVTVTLKFEGEGLDIVNILRDFLNTSDKVSAVTMENLDVEEFTIKEVKPRNTLPRMERLKRGQKMRTMRNKGITTTEIGKKFGIGSRQVSRILSYDLNVRPKKNQLLVPEMNEFKITTEADIRNLQIVELHKSGIMPVAIGDKFGLRPSTISTLCWRAKKEGWY